MSDNRARLCECEPEEAYPNKPGPLTCYVCVLEWNHDDLRRQLAEAQDALAEEEAVHAKSLAEHVATMRTLDGALAEAQARERALVMGANDMFLCPFCGRVNPEREPGNGGKPEEHTEECPANPVGRHDAALRTLCERVAEEAWRPTSAQMTRDACAVVDRVLGGGDAKG